MPLALCGAGQGGGLAAARPAPLGDCGKALAAKLRVQDRYQKLEKIGEGSCGVVFKCRDSSTGALVAVKKVHFSYECEGGQPFGVPAAALREVSALRMLAPHPNVVTLHEAVVERERIFLVCEFLDRDLRCHLNKVGRLPPARAKRYGWQLLRGLAHCHEHRVAHRDVKPQNLLVDVAADCVKLCDFSLARPLFTASEPQTRRVASLWYRSPELLLGAAAEGLALDAWSAGCVLGELLTRGPLFPGGSEIETLLLIFRRLGTPSESAWPGLSQLPHWSKAFPRFRGEASEDLAAAAPAARELLARLLRLPPPRRLPPQRALAHGYFLDLDTAGAPPRGRSRSRGRPAA